MERWLLTSAKGSVRESTYESYRKQVERYVVPAVGRVKLKRLSAMQIQGMYRAMLDRSLSPAPCSTPTPSCTGRSGRRSAGA